MSAELWVELDVADPGACPVADASTDATAISSVTRASVTDDEGRIAEEFTAEHALPEPGDATEVAEHDTGHVYRIRRARDRGCVCDRVESFGTPVVDVRAAAGTLSLSFHTASLDTVQNVVAELRDEFGGVRLRKLVRSEGGESSDPVFVDRSRLTERQREVLRTAHELGYFEHPKGANANDVADALDISPSTFTEHLAAAQRKVLDAVLEH
ncbi:putative DNA binding protein [Halarchaeum solikamskense]|uniref:helix-turn-helix domain-containing protein n=1 Tax=Halarchaeum nitratireducens TaxID=489913 RepID=UPI001B3B0553|nr:helix-turn-helix domain-containing protein [Halarchaeum solikamskense]MBP2251025.1 putative DNA binding protein [Halarchaeum solikamskense]